MPEDPELQRITVVLPSPGRGKGLFARLPLPEGVVIARMRECGRMRRSEVDAYLARHPDLPHDCIIYVARSSLVFYDQSWPGGRIPRWYRLNHSGKPTASPRIANPSATARDQVIEWVTTRPVRALEELTFHYQDPDPDWK